MIKTLLEKLKFKQCPNCKGVGWVKASRYPAGWSRLRCGWCYGEGKVKRR